MLSWRGCSACFRVAVLLAVTVGCGASAELDSAATGQHREAFINGADDRQEYFEIADAAERSGMDQFAVALVSRSAARQLQQGAITEIPTWSETSGLCSGEAYADQPAAAFCSGVLVDWDLVLTSGHCVDRFAPGDYRVVFGYYYAAPGELALAPDDIYEVKEVVLYQQDPSDQEEKLDFGWVRLAERVRPPHRPAAVHTQPPGAELGEPVISIGAGGGVPIKLDGGGQVLDVRAETEDYFVANTDTSEGSSGGGIYDTDLAVLGTLARGAPDFVTTSEGCATSDHESDPSRALEQFNYAFRAVEALCATGATSQLCDTTCQQPCAPSVRPPDPEPDDDGCSLAGPRPPQPRAAVWLGALGILGALGCRRRRQGSP
jgi:hypothetical protein